MVKVGIIGGSGLDEPGLVEDEHEEEVEIKIGGLGVNDLLLIIK